MRSHPAVPWLFRTSALLWVIWGVVHLLAGLLTLSGLAGSDVAGAIHALTPGADPESLQLDYPAALVALLSQHGFNLAWFGVVTVVAAPFVWRGRRWGFYVAALVAGLADLGYFIYIDLGGYALPPGPQMTWICAAAIITGFLGLRLNRSGGG